MTATYSGDPSTSPLDEMRFRIGDTVTAAAYLQDAEITYCISLERTTYGAIARCHEAIAARFHHEAELMVGSLRMGLELRAQRYEALAREWRERANAANLPYFGGESQAERIAEQRDPDRYGPQIKIGLTDYPVGVGPAGQ